MKNVDLAQLDENWYQNDIGYGNIVDMNELPAFKGEKRKQGYKTEYFSLLNIMYRVIFEDHEHCHKEKRLDKILGM